jgi:hypothetical protein
MQDIFSHLIKQRKLFIGKVLQMNVYATSLLFAGNLWTSE